MTVLSGVFCLTLTGTCRNFIYCLTGLTGVSLSSIILFIASF